MYNVYLRCNLILDVLYFYSCIILLVAIALSCCNYPLLLVVSIVLLLLSLGYCFLCNPYLFKSNMQCKFSVCDNLSKYISSAQATLGDMHTTPCQTQVGSCQLTHTIISSVEYTEECEQLHCVIFLSAFKVC